MTVKETYQTAYRLRRLIGNEETRPVSNTLWLEYGRLPGWATQAATITYHAQQGTLRVSPISSGCYWRNYHQ
jgi:hypothetical protein